jgi:hypothetical protein
MFKPTDRIAAVASITITCHEVAILVFIIFGITHSFFPNAKIMRRTTVFVLQYAHDCTSTSYRFYELLMFAEVLPLHPSLAASAVVYISRPTST